MIPFSVSEASSRERAPGDRPGFEPLQLHKEQLLQATAGREEASGGILYFVPFAWEG